MTDCANLIRSQALTMSRSADVTERALGQLCELYAAEGLVATASRLRTYLDHILGGLRFEDAMVLDVGSGTGAIAAYAALRGATRVVALEPERAGGTKGARSLSARLFDAMDVASRIELRDESLGDFSPAVASFDIVLLHNSVNHLDENACMRLGWDEDARRTYAALFARIAALARPGATLFVCDCSPRNFFAALRLRNPIALTLDWRKHQKPGAWIALLREAGFTDPHVSWTPPSRLPRIARRLAANSLVSYFTTSHWSLTMTRTSS